MGEQGSVPIEYDKKLHTAVTRLSLIGRNGLGRPYGKEIETAYFTSEKEAQSWICEKPEFSHHVCVPFETKPFYSWVERTFDGDTITIDCEGRKRVSPRNVEDHHGIQTGNRREVVAIIIHVAQRDDPKIERGLAWISGENGPLYFVLNPGENDPQELEKTFQRVRQKARKVYNDLMEGETVTTSDLKPANTDPKMN